MAAAAAAASWLRRARVARSCGDVCGLMDATAVGLRAACSTSSHTAAMQRGATGGGGGCSGFPAALAVAAAAALTMPSASQFSAPRAFTCVSARASRGGFGERSVSQSQVFGSSLSSSFRIQQQLQQFQQRRGVLSVPVVQNNVDVATRKLKRKSLEEGDKREERKRRAFIKPSVRAQMVRPRPSFASPSHSLPPRQYSYSLSPFGVWPPCPRHSPRFLHRIQQAKAKVTRMAKRSFRQKVKFLLRKRERGF